MSIGKQKEKILGRPYRRKTYILISPKGKKYIFFGRIQLENFIFENNLSTRILKFYNKGKINKKDVRNLKKETKNIKTNNFIGWEIKLILKKTKL